MPRAKPSSAKSASGRRSKGAKGENNPRRVRSILAALDRAYPTAHCELHHASPFQLLVATILSAQCTDQRVNLVTPGLFAKYPGPADFAAADPLELQQAIRSTGFFRNKAKSIIGASTKLLQDFGGNIPRSMAELLTLPGVARKTANVVLGTSFGTAEGVVVDTHVQRLSQRLGLTKQSDPKKIETDLMAILPRERWIAFSHQLIWHGRRVCRARNPLCRECSLAKLCHSKDKNIS